MRRLILMFIFVPILTYAELRIPGNLTAADENTALEILGLSTVMKTLGDPFPLGGYSGIEFGLTMNVISSAEIARLGSRTTAQSETNYHTLTAGKGLYRNLDALVSFSHAGQSENIQSFGMQFRWGVFQAEYLPIYSSLVLSMASTNFNNLIITNNYNLDILFGFKEGDLTLYFGGGMIRALGTFSGGTGGVTASGKTDYHALTAEHVLAGLNVKFGNWFTAFELDRSSGPTYSAKLGYRF